jgi:hypothetical protein
VHRHAQALAEHAVDAHPHDEPALVGLDMNVADAAADGLGDDPVDQADRRRVVGAVEQILRRGNAAREGVELVIAVDGAREARGTLVHRVAGVEKAVELRLADLPDAERSSEITADLDQHGRVGAFTDRHSGAAIVA